MYLGFLITLVVLLPNLFFLRFPPVSVPPERNDRQPSDRITEILERIGQVACFVLPCLYRIDLNTTFQWLALVMMVGALALYYAGWLRYLRQGHTYRLLFSPMLGIPLPLAVAPVLYFLFAAMLLATPWLAIGAIVLALGHIPVSARQWKRAISAVPGPVGRANAETTSHS